MWCCGNWAHIYSRHDTVLLIVTVYVPANWLNGIALFAMKTVFSSS